MVDPMMLQVLKEVLRQAELTDVVLAGFFDPEGGEFSPMLHCVYLEFGSQMLELKATGDEARLRLTLVDRVQHHFEVDDDFRVGQVALGEMVLRDPLASNAVVRVLTYGMDEGEDELRCDAMRLDMANGQVLFFDPSFHFGISIGGDDQEDAWKENRQGEALPAILTIDVTTE